MSQGSGGPRATQTVSPEIAAVVVHYRMPADTAACLDALRAVEGLDVYLVDNSGCGEGLTLARERGEPVRALDAGGNRGWAGGCNLGISAALAAGATHVLLINSDASVEADAIEHLVRAVTPDDVGAATGKVLLPRPGPGAPPRIWAAGGRIDEGRAAGVNIGEGQLDGPAFDVARDVDFGSGCFLLVTRRLFERVGLLDERFFLYMEDVELCERARRAGLRIRYEPAARCLHKAHGAAGGAWDDPGPVTVYYLTRSRFLYARERASLFARGRGLAWLLATRGIKAGAALASGRPARARLILSAVRDGLRGRQGPAEVPSSW